MMTFQATFLPLSRASKPKMTTTHLTINLIVRTKLLGESESLIKANLTLTPFRDRSLVRLSGGAVTTREEGAYVLSG